MAGAANVLLTNLVLQLLLASSLVNLATATFISQLVNTCFGYVIYGKLVFAQQSLGRQKPIAKYLFLMAGMWALNTAGIGMGAALGASKNLAAVVMIPILAILSFITQKNWVFRS